MTMRIALFCLCLLTLLIPAGCSKADKPAQGATVQPIDATRIGPAFSSAPAEVQSQVDAIKTNIADSNLAKALEGLEKLSKLPDLTEQQKKAVEDLTSQLQKKLAIPAARPPVQ